MKWADYCVSKLILNNNGFIESIICCEDLGESLSSNISEYGRSWMVKNVLEGKSFCCITKNSSGRWKKIGDFNYDGRIFKWKSLPKNITKRKTFISYYHKEDQEYKELFKNLFDDLIIHKSVEVGDINADNSDDYIKKLIQNGYLVDTTVLIILIGPNTKHRKHVDWEISGAINPKVGEKCSGILGLKLPSHADFGTGKHNYSNLPGRLADNLKSEYAIIRDWTEDRIKLQRYIEEANNKRASHYGNRDNSRLQMKTNTNE